ncbi:transcription factor like [Capsicum galapagoense]
MESCLKSKSAPKLERKYVEKNRRKHMKNLYNQLHSMIPTHASTSKAKMKVPDQIDAAVNYIESLKMNLEKSKQHLKELKLGPKRAQSLNATNEPGPSTKSPTQIEFHEMGLDVVVVLITGLDNIATFNNIIRLCHREEGVEVVSTSFKLNGDSTLQIYRETKVHINRNSTMKFTATTLCDKMKELIYGPSCNNDRESNLHCIVESKLLGFNALELNESSTMKFRDTIVCDKTKELVYEKSCNNDMEFNLHLRDDIVEFERLESDVLELNKSATMKFKATTMCDNSKELIHGPSYNNDMNSNLHLWDDIVESEMLGFDALEQHRSSTMEFRATTICDNSKELVHGPPCNDDMDSNLHLWDDIVESKMLGFGTLEVHRSSTMEFRAITICDNSKELVHGPPCNNDTDSNIHLWDDIVESEMLGFDALELNKSSTMEFGATTMSDNSKELIHGPSCNNDMDSDLHLWNGIFESELLGFDALELMPTPSQIPNMPSNYVQNVYETASF